MAYSLKCGMVIIWWNGTLGLAMWSTVTLNCSDPDLQRAPVKAARELSWMSRCHSLGDLHLNLPGRVAEILVTSFHSSKGVYWVPRSSNTPSSTSVTPLPMQTRYLTAIPTCFPQAWQEAFCRSRKSLVGTVREVSWGHKHFRPSQPEAALHFYSLPSMKGLWHACHMVAKGHLANHLKKPRCDCVEYP